MDFLFVSLSLSFSKHAGDKSLNATSLAKVWGPCVDVENAGVSARAWAAHLKPFCMWISGKVQQFSKRKARGVLKKATGVSIAHSAMMSCSPTTFRREQAVFLLPDLQLNEKLHTAAEKQIHLQTPIEHETTRSLRHAWNKFLWVRAEQGCPAPTVLSRWLKHRTDRKPHLPSGPRKFTFTSRANAISQAGFSSSPLSKHSWGKCPWNSGTGSALDKCPLHYTEALEW